jgi:hypothetical protein
MNGSAINTVDYFRVYQAEARASGHGLWGLDSEEKIASPDKIVESEYIGNRNSHVFHRLSCDDEREKPPSLPEQGARH